jgi:hypothetical protein
MSEFRSSDQTGRSFIAGITFGLKPVVYARLGGRAIFEGDIDLGSVEQMEEVRQQIENPPSEPTPFGVGITGTQFRWPNATIPFRFATGFPNSQRVTDAITHIQNNTNLRFQGRTSEVNFVTFQTGDGCSSQVGMRGGEQFVTLGTACGTGNAIHEICHTAGLWHEQSREDRDAFVTVNFANIDPAMAFNFNQQITDGDDLGHYDYGSIMHYPRNAFAINPATDTITPKPNANVAIGQRTGLSAGDIAALNLLYPRRAVLGDTSNVGPALTSNGARVLLGWVGKGNLQLNFMSSADGLSFANKVTLGDISPAALALASFQNRFVVAWIGVGNNQLNVLQSADGVTWGNKVTLGDTSQSSPALAVLGNRLILAWRGAGNNLLNVMSSSDAVHWGGKVTLGDTTTSAPTLAVLNNQLLLGWRGVGNNNLNVMRSANGTTFGSKVTLGETTVAKPGLHVRGNRALLTWQGVGNLHLNVLTSDDGVNWGAKFISPETCIDGPVISQIGNGLVWGWTGTDPDHRLNTLLFNVV